MEGEKTPYNNPVFKYGEYGTDVSRHTLLMIIGCIAPLAILAALWFAGVSQNILTFGILLLCPIMHLVMMKNMKHGETPVSEDKTPHFNAGINKREL